MRLYAFKKLTASNENDAAKTNLAAILEQSGVANVRSL